MNDPPAPDGPPDAADRPRVLNFQRLASVLDHPVRADRPVMPEGRPTVSFGFPGSTDLPDSLPIGPDATAGPHVGPADKPDRPRRERPKALQDAPIDPPSTVSAAARLLQRRAHDAGQEMHRLEGLSGENAERTRRAQEEIAWAGDDATPAMRAALKAGEAEDARLVKLWMAAGKVRSGAERELKRAERAK